MFIKTIMLLFNCSYNKWNKDIKSAAEHFFYNFLLFAIQQEIPDVPLNPNELPDPEERTGWRKYISIKKD